MKHVYIVIVCAEYAMPRVSQEAYASLALAQSFIERRSDGPKKLSDFKYASNSYEYLIQELTVR